MRKKTFLSIIIIIVVVVIVIIIVILSRGKTKPPLKVCL